MKKFLRKIFIYFLVLSAIVLTTNVLYLKMERKLDLYNIGAFLKEVPDNIQICNFGASHGNSFNYTNLRDQYTCFNFSLAAQSYSYDYRILQAFKEKIKKGAIVFIPVSYFSFFGIPESQEQGFAGKNSRYYKFLPANLIKEYDKVSDIFINYFPALVPDNVRAFVEHFYQPDESLFENGVENPNAEARYRDHVLYGKFDDSGNRIYKYEDIEALYAIIDTLKTIDARIILITTPFLREYNDAVRNNDPNFFREFHAIIDEIVKKTGVEYYDYSDKDRYSLDHSIFVDADHLNKKGSRRFTDELMYTILESKSNHLPRKD